MLDRRGFLRVLSGLVAAPAVCKAEILMPVRSIIVIDKNLLSFDEWYIEFMERQANKFAKEIANDIIYGNPLFNGPISGLIGTNFRIRLPNDFTLDKLPRFR